MKLTTTTTGKRTVTTTLVDNEVPFNVAVHSPKYAPTDCVQIHLGYDRDDRYVMASMSLEEAKKLIERLSESVKNAEANSSKW